MTNLETKILKTLLQTPERELYAQEIAKDVSCSKASTSGILASFTAKKMVIVHTRGRMKFYRINTASPDVKSFAIQRALRTVQSLTERVKQVSSKVILFGSASRGEQTADSDLDLLIVTTDKTAVKERIRKSVSRIQVNAIVKTPSEWSEMEVRNPELYYEIKNGITLHDHVARI